VVVGVGAVGVVGTEVVGVVVSTVERSGSSFSPQPATAAAKPVSVSAIAVVRRARIIEMNVSDQRHMGLTRVGYGMGTSRAMLRCAIRAAAIAGCTFAAALLAPAPHAEATTGTCDGFTAKVRGAKVIRGGPGEDVLIGSGRSQKIFAGGGDDHVCAGGGNDIVHGRGGDDVIHGDGRGDMLFGNAGSDRLYGDILDDHLMGGSGADALVGGHGVDKMFGGSGNDLLRGGTNRDCFYGQGGANTASFATATPPGIPESGISGVQVDLDQPTKGACPRRGTGRAEGDGSGEVLKGIQFVVGSAFGDAIVGLSGTGVDAGLGSDACSGFHPAATVGCAGGDEAPAGTFAYVFEPATGAPADPGLIVRAADGVASQSFTISGAGAGATVNATGAPLVRGPRCDLQGTCTPTTGTLAYVMVWGGDGADTVTVGAGLPPSVSVDLDGGPGDDALNGSDYLGEVLFGGDSPGADALRGNGGADALVSEGGNSASGPDALEGGPDDDQLVTDYPCAGHSFSGGPGADVAGFARSGVGIRARIGGLATLAGGGCRGGTATTILRDNEVLEGTPKADRLTGSARSETLWGREGNDVLIGEGGADILRAFAGRDLIDARDRGRDRQIQCGAGRDRAARRDRVDPNPISC
jgi:Ca2+-binding RTX toxin-like protein